MRYIIEPTDAKSQERLLKFIQEDKAFNLVSSYDPIENLSTRVEKLGIALREFKASGVNWTVFKFYLRGRGLSNQIVDNVMGKVEDFFKEVGLK